MNYQSAKKFKPADFKRRFGIKPNTFKRMVKAVEISEDISPNKRGAKPKLSLEDKILVAIEYWREYRTYFHIGTDWGVSESTVCRIVHQIESRLMQSGQFRLPGKKTLVQGFGEFKVVVMDITETPIERPKKRQKEFYSGKKKVYILKAQLIVDPETRPVICTFFGRGRRHDFALFKASRIHFHPEIESIQDSGYQGIQESGIS